MRYQTCGIVQFSAIGTNCKNTFSCRQCRDITGVRVSSIFRKKHSKMNDFRAMPRAYF